MSQSQLDVYRGCMQKKKHAGARPSVLDLASVSDHAQLTPFVSLGTCLANVCLPFLPAGFSTCLKRAQDTKTSSAAA